MTADRTRSVSIRLEVKLQEDKEGRKVHESVRNYSSKLALIVVVNLKLCFKQKEEAESCSMAKF